MRSNDGSNATSEKERNENPPSAERECPKCGIEKQRIDLLREMLNMARHPDDPENGIYPCDYPFAKLGIQRLQNALSRKDNGGGYLARIDEWFAMHVECKADPTQPEGPNDGSCTG